MNDVTRLLRIVGDFIAKLSQKDVEDLINRRSHLTLVSRHGATKAGTAAKQLTDQAAKEILTRLNGSATRENGIQILKKDCETRSCLEALARSADLPVQKRDTVVILRDRIIEATIGYRLRSRAIRGKDSLQEEL